MIERRHVDVRIWDLSVLSNRVVKQHNHRVVSFGLVSPVAFCDKIYELIVHQWN